MNKKTRATAFAAAAAGLVLAVAAPLSASAHVTVNPSSAAAGSYTVLTLKVPNESDTAGTNRVELSLPTDTPFTSVRYVPVAGWSTELVRETLPKPVKIGESEITEAVTKVIWTADAGSEIVTGQLQQFDLSVGPVPDTGSVLLPAAQSYTDGTVVNWAEEGEDAQHPAPVLYINDAPAGDHHGAATTEHDDDDAAAAPAATDDVLARVLGIAGLALGAVGIALAITSRRARNS